MDVNPTQHVSIIDRAKAIILKPKEEWPVIERETRSSGEIFTGYVMPLAAIGPVASFLGGQLFGYGMLWIHFRPSLLGALGSAILQYVASLVGVFLITYVANALAPKFGGESSQSGAFKLVAYSMTAGWVAGIFGLIPSLAFLTLAGLYSLYLFNVGATPLLKVPQDKTVGFTATVCAIVLVIGLVIGGIVGAVGGLVGGTTAALFGSHVSDSSDVTINVPGAGVTLDSRKIEQASQDMQAALKTGGNGKAIAPDALQALLPDSIGVYKRTAVESVAAGPAGSHAEGTYESSGKSFRLKVSDMSAVGALASLGVAFGVQENKEDADGYERTTTKDGVLTSEKWRKSGDGSYGTMVGKRFFIEAEGEANSIDELKGAVASIDAGKLAALAGS